MSGVAAAFGPGTHYGAPSLERPARALGPLEQRERQGADGDGSADGVREPEPAQQPVVPPVSSNVETPRWSGCRR